MTGSWCWLITREKYYPQNLTSSAGICNLPWPQCINQSPNCLTVECFATQRIRINTPCLSHVIRRQADMQASHWFLAVSPHEFSGGKKVPSFRCKGSGMFCAAAQHVHVRAAPVPAGGSYSGKLVVFRSLYILHFLRVCHRIFNIWSIKCRLSTKLITDLVCKLRDESNELN